MIRFFVLRTWLKQSGLLRIVLRKEGTDLVFGYTWYLTAYEDEEYDHSDGK